MYRTGTAGVLVIERKIRPRDKSSVCRGVRGVSLGRQVKGRYSYGKEEQGRVREEEPSQLKMSKESYSPNRKCFYRCCCENKVFSKGSWN